MLKFNPELKAFESLDATEMKTERMLERLDLQKAIVTSWDLFKNEIGLPSAFLIGDEVKPHMSTQDSIDILAYDPDESALIVVELKRGKDKLQLLQALSYAAMVSEWDSDTVVDNINRAYNPDPQELIDLVNSGGVNADVKVVLVAEYYDPEAILTADWLRSRYSVDISAYAASVHKMGDQAFLTLEQRYPLKELEDVYEARRTTSQRPRKNQDVTWDDVIPKLRYPFARRGVELCRRLRAGDASRRRFAAMRTSFEGFTWVHINFRQDYINVYLKGDFEGAKELIESKFRDRPEVKTWKLGYSVLVRTESQFEDMAAWLKLES